MFHVKQYDVIVVGGGHAGTEAAAAAARRGARVALVTHRADTIGVMSCNPSIGGIGKGHLVREIDALDGLMARAADAAGIHFRLLNRSKGPAVQGPRVQADRRRYRAAINRLIAGPGIDVIEGDVTDLEMTDHVIGVVIGEDTVVHGRAIVLATGTFLGGRIFRGEERAGGGRIDERPATRLADRLRDRGLPLRRLKTGTPPRLDGRTIDWATLERQPSDPDRWMMSAMSERRPLPQLACAITRTTAVTHDIIRAGLHRSPLHGGEIIGHGPRYCPSIEDKVHRFGDRDGHQIFLEPEGLDDPVVYPNGISTSLDVETQRAMIASIPGLAQARITMAGYAVEYDHIDPRALSATLEIRAMPAVFCCGQLNGTTGYEEAAGQGLVAGSNAAALALDLEPMILDRASSYLGVMIDDLVVQGVTEPYRLLTARAEYRLALRADNAGTRLSAIGAAHGLLSPSRRAHADTHSAHRAEIATCETAVVPDAVRREFLADRHYAPYVVRQQAEIDRMRRDEAIGIVGGPALALVPGLSTEMIERLGASGARTLGQAARVPGVTPAALTALWLHARATA